MQLKQLKSESKIGKVNLKLKKQPFEKWIQSPKKRIKRKKSESKTKKTKLNRKSQQKWELEYAWILGDFD